MEASPSSIPADGKSHSLILVTVFDQNGSVKEDAEVQLTTTAGDITPIVYTSGGRASGILTSSVSPQIAVVSAITEGVSGAVQVEFTPPDREPEVTGMGTVRMSGGTLAYSVDRDTVLASSGTKIEYRGLSLEAASAQVCQSSGEIRAQGQVVIRKPASGSAEDDAVLSADAAFFDLRKGLVHLIDWEDNSEVRTYDLLLQPTEEASAHPQVFSPLADVSGNTWIISDRLVLIPGERVLFYKASTYVGDLKVFTLPYYSYSYDKRESIMQQVRFSSHDGIVVDFPFFYRMADSGTGALKLRYAANGVESGGYHRPPKGLSFGVEEHYSFGDKNQGRVFIDSVANSNRALELAHHLEYGSVVSGGYADISARYQPASMFAKDTYIASANIHGTLKNYTYSFSGYAGRSNIIQRDYLDPENVTYLHQSSENFRLTGRPKTLLKLGDLKLSPSLTLGYGSLWSSSGVPASSSLYQSLRVTGNHTPFASKSTSFRLNGAVEVTAASGETGASLRLSPTLSTRWTGGHADLGYTLNLQDGISDSVSSLGTHQLRCSMGLFGGANWNSFLSASYGLDTSRLNVYGSVNYRPAERWRVESGYSLYRYAYNLNDQSQHYSTSYLKVGVFRSLGMYEVGLVWSPYGRNYGIDKDRHFWLELGGIGF